MGATHLSEDEARLVYMVGRVQNEQKLPSFFRPGINTGTASLRLPSVGQSKAQDQLRLEGWGKRSLLDGRS